VIPNAWHFSFHCWFCVYGGMVKFRGSVAHTLMRRYVLWEKMEMDIPDRFKNVRYVSSRIPGCKDDSDLTLGANCQIFAYNLLRDFGLNPPNYRSSELWDDSEFSEVVTEFKPLDIMMYNDSTDSYGAHVGVYAGNGIVYHLSLSNGVPKFGRHLDLLQQSKYRFFIGAKRVKRSGA